MKLTEDFYRELIDAMYEGVYFVDADRTISYWSKGAERMTGFKSTEVVGSRCSDNILRHVDAEGCELCEKRCPIAAVIAEGRPRTADISLRHKDGHLVPITARVTPIHSANGDTTGAIQIFVDKWASIDIRERVKELEDLTALDVLTGLPNRRSLESSLQERLTNLENYGLPFGILMIDVDNLKPVNDRHGHLVGDELLRMVSRTLASNLRMPDVVGRWGGDEFVAVLPYGGQEQLKAAAERLRRTIEGLSLRVGDVTASVTISIGVTEARPGDTLRTLFGRADRLLYQSKSVGRNRVTVG